MTIVDGYTTLTEVKADLRLTTTVDDSRLERKIEAASRTIDDTTHRTFVTSGPSARMFTSSGVMVWIDDAQAVTLVEESSDQTTWSTVAATARVFNVRSPIYKITRIGGAEWLPYVRVTGTWGNGTVPTKIREACIILAIRYFKRPDTPEGVLTGDFGAARLGREDPDVARMIKPFIRKVIG
jgi:hypothetical protein